MSMLYSMTGFGRGEAAGGGHQFTVEIRAVNNRYCDISLKTPRFLAGFDERVRGKVAARVARGKLDVYVSYEPQGAAEAEVTLDTGLADAYFKALRELRDRYSLKEEVGFSDFLHFQDVIKSEGRRMDEDEAWAVLGGAVDAALDALTDMRGREGAKLAQDITAKLLNISVMVTQLEARAPLVAASYKERLEARLKELLGAQPPVDEARIAAEVAIFADRCSVDEELVRLKSHLSQAGRCMSASQPVGRKMDFIIQEINREINTIGAKSNDLDMNSCVVEMKSELEKVREQVQNLE